MKNKMLFNNKEISKYFYDYADILESKNDNPYRVRAYRRAARSISHLDQELQLLIDHNKDLTDIPYIGKVIAAEIKAIFKSGFLNIQKNISKRIPKVVVEKKSKTKRFFRLFHIIPSIESYILYIKKHSKVKDAIPAGGYRRKENIINEIDIIVLSGSTAKNDKIDIINYCKEFYNIYQIFKTSINLLRVKLTAGIVVNIKFVTQSLFGSSLLFSTGSDSHINRLINISESLGMRLTKNGLFKNERKRNKKIAGKTENVIYQKLNLSFIPPEIRENQGEIELAQENKLPELIKLEDIKGDLHCHTYETDGQESIETMAKTALNKGYEYLAITDHSQHLKITNGMNKKRLLKQIKEIDKINEKLNGIVILKSIEVDILIDGSLDMPDSVLKELDLTVCSIHSQFRISKIKQTERILRAMDNKYFNILGHATGRLIRKREPYELDIERILLGLKERGCFLELNSQPYRLDVKDEYCKLAKQLGLKLAISSDAHSIREMNYMQYGVYEARRGWISAEDVINTRNLKKLKEIIKRN